MANTSAEDTTVPASTSVRDFVSGPKTAARVSFRDDTDTISIQRLQKLPSRSSWQGASVDDEAEDDDTQPEEDPWIPKYTLCLDGGGIRGYSTLLIIKRLMDNVKAIEEKTSPPAASSAAPYVRSKRRDAEVTTTIAVSGHKPQARLTSASMTSSHTLEDSAFLPCHYFNYIAGTSTGGLIAIMLSRLRMSVEDCIEAYTGLGKEIFGRPREPRFGIPRSLKYRVLETNTKKLGELLTDMVKSKGSKESVDQVDHFASRPDSCRTIVVTLRKSSSSSVPYILRTYEHPISGEESDPLERNPGDPLDCSVWEACRATSAAPTFFKPIRIKGQKFLDGGLVSNNPTWLVMNEIGQMHGSKDNIDLFLSIGTGLSSSSIPIKNGGTLTRVISPSKLITASKERNIRLVQEQAILETEYLRYDRFKYERFDVDNLWDLGSSKSEAKLWRKDSTLDKIRSATDKYLSRRDIEISLEETARKLVERRRLRAKTARWESFVFGVKYRCNEEPCLSLRRVYENRDDLVAHMQRRHKLNSPGPDNIDAIQEMLEKSKTRQWSYNEIASH